MNIILILIAGVVVSLFYKATMTLLEQPADSAHVAEAQRQHANAYRALERRERDRAMRR